MKAILLIVMVIGVAAFGQDTSFAEVSQRHLATGDAYVMELFAQQNSTVEDVEDPDVTRLRTCLSEVGTAQEIYFIDFFTYTDLETLFESSGRPESCEGVGLVESHLVVGSLGDFSSGINIFENEALADAVASEDPDAVRLQACLSEVRTAQALYFIDFGIYTNDLEALFESFGRPESCEGVEIADSEGYLILGSLGDLSYQVTTLGGVEEVASAEDPNVIRPLRTCLREVATAQELYFIDFGTYTDDLETLFELRSNVSEACQGIDLETVEASDNDYLIIGSLDNLSYQVSASGPIEPIR
ncbi:MAG: hypothetical protein U5L04_10935 [Trueperaceae bacterium]|nr:hypothetical protein [Trueperaceae bacterium]